MKKMSILSLVILFWACSSEELPNPYPCIDGDCDAIFRIDTISQPNTYQDVNGYYHVEHMGINYFTISGDLDIVHPEFEVNNVPQVEVGYDSNYWVWINSFSFTVPLYSFLGYFTSGDFNNPIPVDTLTYTITDMAHNFPPLNIAGYSINPNQCVDCPYSSTLIGTYSKYTYKPKQNIFFDDEMVGDTCKVIMKASWNTTNIGKTVEKEYIMNIIFE